MTATEALSALADTLRARSGGQPFTVTEIAAEFPHRRRAWIAAQMRMHADGGNLLPGITLSRYPRHGGIYSVLPQPKES